MNYDKSTNITVTDNTQPVRILLVDDEKLIRQALRLLLDSDSRLRVVAEAENGQEAIEQAKAHEPDVILMDIRMPVMDGREATKHIQEILPRTAILILTTFSDMEYIKEALQYGARGYLLKDSSPELLISSILAVSKGSVVVHPEIAEKLVQQSALQAEASSEISAKDALSEHDYGLTNSELELVKHLASGLNNKELSEKLFISEGTVKNKVSTILQKLQLRDRTQLAIFAWENNLIH